MEKNTYNKKIIMDEPFIDMLRKHCGDYIPSKSDYPLYMKKIDIQSVDLDEDMYVAMTNIIKACDVIGETYSNTLIAVLDFLQKEYPRRFPDGYDIESYIFFLILFHLIGGGVLDSTPIVSGTLSVSKNSWDSYFYGICKAVAENSKCFSRQIGAILVKDKSIISTGYNGPPRGVPPCDQRVCSDAFLQRMYVEKNIIHDKELIGRCPRQVMQFKSGRGLEWCPSGHAERNSLINAARMGICTKDAIMYMSCAIPCTPCLVEIINAGIKEIVVTKKVFYDVSGEWLLNNSNLLCRVYDHLKKNYVGEQSTNEY